MMHDRSARLFMGLGALVIVWIVVYWSWPVDEPGVTSVVTDPGVDPGTDGPVVIDQSGPPRGPDRGTGVIPPAVIPEVPERAEPPSPPPASTGVIQPEFRDYIIKQGDIGWERISERVYGTRRHWRAVSGANPLLDPRKLRVGMVIRVPVDPGNVQGLPVDPADDDRPRGEPATPDRPTVEYTVERGDTLSSIAKSFYGSVRYVDFLYDANRDRLRSKDDLRLGQVLLVPPLPAEVGD